MHLWCLIKKIYPKHFKTSQPHLNHIWQVFISGERESVITKTKILHPSHSPSLYRYQWLIDINIFLHSQKDFRETSRDCNKKKLLFFQILTWSPLFPFCVVRKDFSSPFFCSSLLCFQIVIFSPTGILETHFFLIQAISVGRYLFWFDLFLIVRKEQKKKPFILHENTSKVS